MTEDNIEHQRAHAHGGRMGGHMGGPPGAGMPEGALPLTGWRQTFGSLSGNRPFQLLFTGNIGFFFGMNMMIILRGWLVEDKWENAIYLGLLMGTVAIPMLFLSPVAGVVTDRVDRRKLVLAAQLLLVVSNSIVAALIITDAIQFWHLLAVSVLSGSAFAFSMPGRQAMVAVLVPRDRLMNAISLSTAAMNASRIVAPSIAGVLVDPIGIGGAYIVSTAFYASAAVATFMLPPMPPKREKEFTFFEDFVEGFSYIKRTAILLGLLLFATIPMIFAMPYQTLMPVFANRVWHVGSEGYGLLQAASGVGGLIGALIVANLDAYPKKARLLIGGALGFGGFVVLFALAPWFYLALIFIAIVGFASMVLMTVNNTAIQLIIPDEVRGRVMAVMMMTFGLMPLGALPAGIAAESIGAPPVVAVSAGLCLASSVLIFFAIPAFRTLDREIEEGKERARELARKEAIREEAGAAAPGGAVPATMKPH